MLFSSDDGPAHELYHASSVLVQPSPTRQRPLRRGSDGSDDGGGGGGPDDSELFSPTMFVYRSSHHHPAYGVDEPSYDTDDDEFIDESEHGDDGTGAGQVLASHGGYVFLFVHPLAVCSLFMMY